MKTTNLLWKRQLGNDVAKEKEVLTMCVSIHSHPPGRLGEYIYHKRHTRPFPFPPIPRINKNTRFSLPLIPLYYICVERHLAFQYHITKNDISSNIEFDTVKMRFHR